MARSFRLRHCIDDAFVRRHEFVPYTASSGPISLNKGVTILAYRPVLT
jgi:hypothetical protein